ncbi:MAG TPA: PfkB family carbohydrate kinase [Pyrinomonadaceae bacterium]|nr:PfkB family carbohydrate kinase [Pyrinomonadaceae bacterium]
MSLLVVGSVAFDAVETPFGKRDKMLGGSAAHFSISASFFTNVRVVAVVGGDFSREEESVFERHNVNISDLERVPDGKCFFWHGRYEYDLNTAHTMETQLNVFADFQPKLSEEAKKSRLVFLGNIQPDLQRGVRDQVAGAELIALDTMNMWIEITRDSLLETIKGVHVMIINDAEARQLAEEPNLIRAARKIMTMGPRALVVKRGEYGAALFTKDTYFAIPAYPLESVFDPTGAGDTFAGGFMGYLASCDTVDDGALARAIIYGSTLASFAVEDFSVDRLLRLTRDDISSRFSEFKKLTHFDVV